MRKRIISLLLAFVMAVSLPSAALAAPGETPPYSLKYLDGIEGAEYKNYSSSEDAATEDGVAVTQMTLELYDVLPRYLTYNGNWAQIIAPFRQRFVDAGFAESESSDNTYSEPKYYYVDGSGDGFVIYGEKESQAILNESGIVYVAHLYSEAYAIEEETPSQPDTPAQPEVPAQASGSLDNFRKSQTYAPGQFADVPGSAWYAPSVQTAYELGLVAGTGAGTFAPSSSITIAETLVLACRLHDIYSGGSGQFTQGNPWYQVYVDYAAANGILSADAVADYTAPAGREVFAFILASALPESALPAINSITAASIPDSGSISASSLPSVLRLYNAGILTGSDAYGTFNPSSGIQRSEVAAIATRMALPGERKSFTPQPKPAAPAQSAPQPEAPAQPETPAQQPAAGAEVLEIPSAVAAIVPSNAPHTVLDSSATKSQLKQIYNNYMVTTISAAGLRVSFADSFIKSGARDWENYLSYAAKGQGKSLTAMEYETRAVEANTNMMRYLREAQPYIDAIEFGARLCPDVFSDVRSIASETSSDLHHLAMSPDMSIASIRLITLQGDMDRLERALDGVEEEIDAMA